MGGFELLAQPQRDITAEQASRAIAIASFIMHAVKTDLILGGREAKKPS